MFTPGTQCPPAPRPAHSALYTPHFRRKWGDGAVSAEFELGREARAAGMLGPGARGGARGRRCCRRGHRERQGKQRERGSGTDAPRKRGRADSAAACSACSSLPPPFMGWKMLAMSFHCDNPTLPLRRDPPRYPGQLMRTRTQSRQHARPGLQLFIAAAPRPFEYAIRAKRAATCGTQACVKNQRADASAE